MKLTSAICIAILAYGVHSSAVANPAAAPEPFCWRPGQPCAKAKRAASALAAAFAEPAAPVDKRAASAEASAEAEAACWRAGQHCLKAKRDALALASAVSEAAPDAHAYYDQLKVRSAFPEPESHDDGRRGGTSPAPLAVL